MSNEKQPLITETPEERARRIGVPLYPARKPLPVLNDNPIVGVCGACGIDIREIMHLACRREDCPLFNSRL
jgi:hypothetical protein